MAILTSFTISIWRIRLLRMVSTLKSSSKPDTLKVRNLFILIFAKLKLKSHKFRSFRSYSGW